MSSAVAPPPHGTAHTGPLSACLGPRRPRAPPDERRVVECCCARSSAPHGAGPRFRWRLAGRARGHSAGARVPAAFRIRGLGETGCRNSLPSLAPTSPVQSLASRSTCSGGRSRRFPRRAPPGLGCCCSRRRWTGVSSAPRSTRRSWPRTIAPSGRGGAPSRCSARARRGTSAASRSTRSSTRSPGRSSDRGCRWTSTARRSRARPRP